MSSPTSPTQVVRAQPAPGDTDNNLLRKVAGLLATGAGLAGLDVISDNAKHSGNWGIFHALQDSVISSIEFQPYANATGSLNGQTIKAGDRIYGFFKSITLASGSGIAYTSAL